MQETASTMEGSILDDQNGSGKSDPDSPIEQGSQRRQRAAEMLDIMLVDPESAPSTLFWHAYTAAQKIPNIHALALLELGASLLIGRQLTEKELDLLNEILGTLRRGAMRLKPVTNDQVAEYTYNQLRQKAMNWDTAALTASTMLGEQIKPDAWRKRVEKWRKEQDLPPVEQRRRRTRSN